MNGGKHNDLAIIIPVKQHSKRLPGKNLAKINGVPLLKLAIDKALQVTDEVYVSSSSEAMLAFAEGWGAKTIKRPTAYDGEVLARLEVMQHAAMRMPEHIKRLMLLQCTNAMVIVNDLYRAASEYGLYAFGATHCGAFYMMPTIEWKAGKDPALMMINEDAIYIHDSIDIDTPEDLERARELLEENDG